MEINNTLKQYACTVYSVVNYTYQSSLVIKLIEDIETLKCQIVPLAFPNWKLNHKVLLRSYYCIINMN